MSDMCTDNHMDSFSTFSDVKMLFRCKRCNLVLNGVEVTVEEENPIIERTGIYPWEIRYVTGKRITKKIKCPNCGKLQ